MEIRTCFKALFLPLNILVMFLQKMSPNSTPWSTVLSSIFSSPTPSSSPLHPENITVEDPQPPQPPPPVIVQHNNLEWTSLIIAFCFASAIEIANQSQNSQSQNSPFFRTLPLAISLAFASLFVAKFVDAKFAGTARVLEQASIFFAATAFFLAVSIPFPIYIKCATWAVYVVSLLAIFICHHY